MKKLFCLAFICLAFISCEKKVVKAPESKANAKESKFQMYEMSEMATLMEQMYAYNTQLKERIINKEDLGEYPVAFDKLHSAILTETSDRDAFFNEQATKFIVAQKAIYENPDKAKENFNAMVNLCLECHAKKCGGPIPRIKKLILP